MSKLGIGSAGDDQSLTQSRLERVVAACDDFEIAWRDGLKPRIEDYLNSRADPASSIGSFVALLAVELELRTRFGEFLVLQDYLDRFPDDASLVRRVFEIGADLGEFEPDQFGNDHQRGKGPHLDRAVRRARGDRSRAVRSR